MPDTYPGWCEFRTISNSRVYVRSAVVRAVGELRDEKGKEVPGSILVMSPESADGLQVKQGQKESLHNLINADLELARALRE